MKNLRIDMLHETLAAYETRIEKDKSRT